VQNRERVVSKDELLAVVWSGRIVSESTRASHINAVRKAIGDSGGEQRLLRAVARNSSFTYKGQTVDVRRVGRELGVRCVLEGSFRKAAKRVRITGQLIDATTGAHIWADRFQGSFDDAFNLQDHTAESVVGAIAPYLERAEIERAQWKPTESLNAYDYIFARNGVYASWNQGGPHRSAGAVLQRDPDFASAYAMAAWCHRSRKLNGLITDPKREIAEGTRLVRRAVELGQDDAVALAGSGHTLAYLVGDLNGGAALTDRAQKLNPNLAAAWFLGGFIRIWRGEPDEAIERFTHAMRLSPLNPEMYRMHGD
jgi:tetratricopeptide (TPR) repeat protein